MPGANGSDGASVSDTSPPPSVYDPTVRARLVDAQAVLICDACSVLDLLQDPWEGNFDDQRRPIARELHARASTGELVVMAPERVFAEMDKHAGRLLGVAAKSLRDAERRARLGYDVLARDGVSTVPAPINIEAYLAIVDDAYRSWRAPIVCMPTSDAARLQALERIERGHAPSSPDKPEVGDCLITETVLETVAAFRADDLAQPCVFLSSNVVDYRRPPKEGPHQARDPLHGEFSALGIRYASGFGQARAHLFPS